MIRIQITSLQDSREDGDTIKVQVEGNCSLSDLLGMLEIAKLEIIQNLLAGAEPARVTEEIEPEEIVN